MSETSRLHYTSLEVTFRDCPAEPVEACSTFLPVLPFYELRVTLVLLHLLNRAFDSVLRHADQAIASGDISSLIINV